MKKIGKDGRKLSSFQQPDWMRKIANKRKYLNPPKGEQNGNAKITVGNVLWMRSVNPGARKFYCRKFGISERHWYSIRARQKWKYI